MVHQVTVSDITDQRTLTESTKAALDDTPETLIILLNRERTHAADIATEHPWRR
jgi:SprT-like protein